MALTIDAWQVSRISARDARRKAAEAVFLLRGPQVGDPVRRIGNRTWCGYVEKPTTGPYAPGPGVPYMLEGKDYFVGVRWRAHEGYWRPHYEGVARSLLEFWPEGIK